ncbi:hypothetical protein [Oceanisphaera pacifica]|uniref:Acetyltransferase n=1 Tax=Oceanisphaera pacifica TaxID=2818389 RepID=A0ABS3NHV5_9GAMM|nr:hypothetical protein [Oceanisphaera pacifica]MBO1520163.1 hypothetical protein [Oceanisphaera pacifica]
MINNSSVLLAKQVQQACLQAAYAAYEEGGLLGLCQQGRFELAMDAIAALDVASLTQPPPADTQQA